MNIFFFIKKNDANKWSLNDRPPRLIMSLGFEINCWIMYEKKTKIIIIIPLTLPSQTTLSKSMHMMLHTRLLQSRVTGNVSPLISPPSKELRNGNIKWFQVLFASNCKNSCLMAMFCAVWISTLIGKVLFFFCHYKLRLCQIT